MRPPTMAKAHRAAAMSDPPAPRLVMSPRKFTAAVVTVSSHTENRTYVYAKLAERMGRIA
jgi:hypothetical protein